MREDDIWITDLRPLRLTNFDFEDNLIVGDNQQGRSQKFIPKPDTNPTCWSLAALGYKWPDFGTQGRSNDKFHLSYG